MRTRKKILTNPKHPRHAAAVRAVHKASEAYGKAECRRMGLDPARWGSYALRWPPRLMYWVQFIRSKVAASA